MSHSAFSQMDSESLKRFTDMSEQEKQAVLALLQLPQLGNTKRYSQSDSDESHNSERTLGMLLNNSLMTPSNIHSGSENHMSQEDESPSNSTSLNNGFVSIDHKSKEMERKDPTNTEVLNVSFDTINLDEKDRMCEGSKTDGEVTVSPCSPVIPSPQVSCSPKLSPRVSSACSEEIAEAFQGQFTETLRTKNDGSARRPMNAYMLFCKMNRTQVKEKNPGLSNREISQILGKMWHDLDKEEWQKYTNMAFELRKAHYVAYPDFKWSKKQKRPASYPSKRSQLEDGDISNIRPRSMLYPQIDFINRNVVPYTYKQLPFDFKKELTLQHPLSLHSVKHSRIPAGSTYRIDNLIDLPCNRSSDDSSVVNLTKTDGITPVKKRKVITPNSGQLPSVSSEELLQHYLIPNLVTPISALFRTPISNIQALPGASSQSSSEVQQASHVHLAVPMYHAGAVASLMSQGIQLIPTDVKSHYLTLQHGLLQTEKLRND